MTNVTLPDFLKDVRGFLDIKNRSFLADRDGPGFMLIPHFTSLDYDAQRCKGKLPIKRQKNKNKI